MATQKYDIPEAFSYEAYTPEGVVEGSFDAGTTTDLTDAQEAYLAAHAVPSGLASLVADAAPPAPPAPVPPAPQEPAPAPSDTQEQAQ